MTISEQIKVLCVRSDINVVELENIAEVVNGSFERKFVLESGEKI